jgi:hypothetical protein
MYVDSTVMARYGEQNQGVKTEFWGRKFQPERVFSNRGSAHFCIGAYFEKSGDTLKLRIALSKKRRK